MKNFNLTRNFVYIIFTICTIAISISCSKDDDDDKKIDETMLESLNKTKWVFDGIGFPAIYLRFNNTKTDYLELWSAFEENECYFYGSSTDDNTLTITENSKTKLVIRATESSDYYSIMTITYVGDKLNVKDEYYVNGVQDDSDNLVFKKTTDNLDNLEICNYGFKRSLIKR